MARRSISNGDQRQAYVVFGGQPFPAQSPLEQTGAELGGFQILAEVARTGLNPRGAGDVNGDGRDDIVVTFVRRRPERARRRAAYVVFGKSGAEQVNLSRTSPREREGSRSQGCFPGGSIGWGQPASGIGDVNHDGLTDLLVGATTDQPPYRGAAYVVFGDGLDEQVDLASTSRTATGASSSGRSRPAMDSVGLRRRSATSTRTGLRIWQ